MQDTTTFKDAAIANLDKFWDGVGIFAFENNLNAGRTVEEASTKYRSAISVMPTTEGFVVTYEIYDKAVESAVMNTKEAVRSWFLERA